MARRDVPALVDLKRYDWSRPDAKDLYRTLLAAYDGVSERHIRLLVRRTGFPESELRFGQVNRSDLWTEILERTPPARCLRPLVLEILEDETVAAWHAEIREIAIGALEVDGHKSPAEPAWPDSPYPGLEPFSAEMAPVFCGRDAEVRDLLRRMDDQACRFVAVLGASGSGKSSLVRAGLIPRLRDERGWIVVTCRPATWDRNPVDSLRLALQDAGAKLTPNRSRELIEAGDAATVRDALLAGTAVGGSEVLLFVDQFEELFTLVEEEDRDVFLRWLATAARTPGMRVVLAMRNDLMGTYMESALLTDLMQGRGYLVKPPDALARTEMITTPARRAGLEVDDGLVEAIRRETGDEPGSLALMAFTLAALYRAGVGQGRIQMAHYEEMGRVSGALERQAEDTYAYAAEKLTDLGADPKEVFAAVFRQLAQVNADNTVTRARVSRRRLCEARGEAAELLVDAFVGGEVEEGAFRPRLLTTDAAVPLGGEGRRHATVEVAHERQFTQWPRLAALIQDCLEDHHVLRQVRQDATEWNRAGRPTDRLLWRHERQLDALRMVEHLGEVVLGERERAFLTPEWRRLVARLDDIDLSHWDRLRIGDRLAVIGGERGDPRPGVGLRGDGLPDLTAEGYWCEVAPGEVELEDGRGSERVDQRFWIARYPITWAQFQCFLDDPQGHRAADWWSGLARTSPQNNPRFRVANRPVGEVSWHDTVAFCRWLSDRLKLPPNGLRLPTEQEWQLAAGGPKPGRTYPWSGTRDGRKANTSEAGLGQTCAVGLYPAGAASCGALDMAGNVWEWCYSEYEQPERTGRGGAATRVARAVRGGSWNDVLRFARASYRNRNNPDNRYQ